MRKYWQQLLHTGKPTDAALAELGLTPLPFITRTTYAGWADGHTLPPAVWYDNLAANLVAPQGWAVIDHEDWGNATQAERLATAGMFATVYREIKARRPEVKFGFYGYAPKRDLFRAKMLPGNASYKEWQAENDDMAAMAAVVDGFFPTIYYFYNTAVNGVNANVGVEDYFRENLREARRIRDAYGDPNRPVFPYVWWKCHAHDADDLDPEAWQPMVEISFSEADGCVLWGGWQNTWDGSASWWLSFKNRLPRKYPAGSFVRATAAGGVHVSA